MVKGIQQVNEKDSSDEINKTVDDVKCSRVKYGRTVETPFNL